MLARTLTELSIQTSYILSDKYNERLARYIEHDWVIRKQMYDYLRTKDELKHELLKRADNEPDKMATIEQVEKEYKRVMDKYHYKLNNGWSDKNIFGMAEETGRSREYKTVYKLQCILCHTNVRSTDEYVKETNDGLVINIGPNQESIEQALVASFDFFRCLLEEGITQFKWPLESKLENLYHRFGDQVK